ncbi:hypothetical protein CJF31_00008178 [Rutstroemia sp. NJR-2017a BVV2]|nr:hypothetical protein CJF31_00008178 [Rutstroemia sp. NJR-2017a BVV2]
MILFETSASVFELMWDIALALFIIRISFFYFALTFASSLIHTFIRTSNVAPYTHLTGPPAEFVAFPLQLLCIMLWARYTIVACELPRVAGFRLAIGMLASIYMVLAELILGFVLKQEGYREWVWDTDFLSAGLGVLSLLLFALMPRLLMGLEKDERRSEGTYHGHETKPITAAV